MPHVRYASLASHNQFVPSIDRILGHNAVGDGGWRHHAHLEVGPSSCKIRLYAKYARRHFEGLHFRLKKAESLN